MMVFISKLNKMITTKIKSKILIRFSNVDLEYVSISGYVNSPNTTTK